MDDVRGKVAVITGAASGIGLALAERLAGEGARLVLADVDAAGLDRAVASFAQAGVPAIGAPTDVSDAQAVQRLADRAWERFGAVHLLFNNAGVAVFGAAQDIGLTEWAWSIDVNLWGVIHGVRAFLPRLLAQGEPAHIVNTASFAGLAPPPSNIAYNVAKAGVIALSESLRLDLAGKPVGVSVLCPMQVGTRIWESSAENRPSDGGAYLRPSDELLASVAGGVMDVRLVTERVLDGIRRNALYILPNDEAQAALDDKREAYRQLS